MERVLLQDGVVPVESTPVEDFLTLEVGGHHPSDPVFAVSERLGDLGCVIGHLEEVGHEDAGVGLYHDGARFVTHVG